MNRRQRFDRESALIISARYQADALDLDRERQSLPASQARTAELAARAARALAQWHHQRAVNLTHCPAGKER